jgi:hypothetical protein
MVTPFYICIRAFVCIALHIYIHIGGHAPDCCNKVRLLDAHPGGTLKHDKPVKHTRHLVKGTNRYRHVWKLRGKHC